MIPNRMAFFWCAPAMSYLRYLSIASFAHFNPDYEVTVYWSRYSPCPLDRECPQDYGLYQGPNFWDALDRISNVKKVEFQSSFEEYGECNPVFKSDLARWELLASEGSLYSDTDILYLRPISLYPQVTATDLCLCFHHSWCLIGFLGSSGRSNLFYRDIFEAAKLSYNPAKYQSTGAHAFFHVLKTNDAHQVQQIIKSTYNLSMYNLPMHVVYPFTYLEHKKIFGPPTTRNLSRCAKSIGVHWFGGIPMHRATQRTLLNHFIAALPWQLRR